MKIKRIFNVIWMIIICVTKIHSQTIANPNFGIKSHETLEITRVEITAGKTVFYLGIENRIEGGSFCADRNIYIVDPEGRKLKLVRSNGIPVCPESRKFKTIGEKLQFTLEFPALKPGCRWIDVVEECNDNCFSFYGVTLDSELNNRINEAFGQSAKGEKVTAIKLLKNILENLTDWDYGIKGAIYTDIITLLVESGEESSAAEWYKKLLLSGIPKLQLYVSNLNSRGIKY
jgi:hypothetical protein